MIEYLGNTGDFEISLPSSETAQQCEVFIDQGAFNRVHASQLEGALSIGLSYSPKIKVLLKEVIRVSTELANNSGLPVHYSTNRDHGVVYPKY